MANYTGHTFVTLDFDMVGDIVDGVTGYTFFQVETMHDLTETISYFIVGESRYATMEAALAALVGFNTTTYPRYRIIGEADRAAFLSAVKTYFNSL